MQERKTEERRDVGNERQRQERRKKKIRKGGIQERRDSGKEG